MHPLLATRHQDHQRRSQGHVGHEGGSGEARHDDGQVGVPAVQPLEEDRQDPSRETSEST
jgi:hypothetical protein